MNGKTVYLDNITATELHPLAAGEMERAMKFYASPSSPYGAGVEVRRLLERCRKETLKLFGGNGNVIFTSGAAESNNLAMKGTAQKSFKKGGHIIISGIEHFSVLHPAKSLERMGFDLTVLPVDGSGKVDTNELRRSIRDDTLLVSINHGSAELGTLQDPGILGEIISAGGALFHLDAANTAGRIPLEPDRWGADLVSFSSYMFHGPGGSGGLYKGEGVDPAPLIEGGLQEGGLRAGAENIPGIAGTAKASSIAMEKMGEGRSELDRLAGAIKEGLKQKMDGLFFPGHETDRIPGHLSIGVKCVDSEALIMMLSSKGIYVSGGSPCMNTAGGESHVFKSAGISPEDARGIIIVCLSRFNTLEDAGIFIDSLPPIADRLRKLAV